MNTLMTTKKQHGFSLISLLIGMALGIFLVAAVIKIYADSKISFFVRDVVANVTENQRFALDDVRRILVMGGRDILSVEDNSTARRPFPPLSTNANAASASGAAFLYDGGSSASDIVAVRFRRGPSCGAYQDVNLVDQPSMVRFLVVNNNLVCELTNYESGTSTSRQVLVGGVEMMKVLYGLDDDGDGYANRYLNATQVNNTNTNYRLSWGRVVSLRIGLVMRSELDLPKSARPVNEPSLSLLGMDFSGTDNQRLWRVASTTFTLRNLNPTVQRQ